MDDGKLAVTYANAYRVGTTADDVVFDFDLSMPDPNAAPNSGESLFNVANRLVMTYPNVKKLRGLLTVLIKRYEDQFGEIPPKAEKK